VTWWGTRVLKTFVPMDIPRLNDAGLNLTVVGFMAGVAALTAVLFSLAPAWQVARLNLAGALKDAGPNAGTSRRRTRRTLVVAEISLAFVLLVGAGLMTRTLVNLITVDAGFVGENVLTIPLDMPRVEGATVQEQAAPFIELLGNLRTQAGVQSAGYTSHVPMSGNDSRTGIGFEGRPPDPNDGARAHWRVVTPGYLQAMQIRLVRGRFPTEAEAETRAPVAVINRTAAERYWPGADPIGQRVRILTPEWREIIAVVDDVRHWGAASPVNPEVYLPGYRNPTNLVVRGSGNVVALTATIREHVRALSPALPVVSITPMNDIRGLSVASSRFYVLLLVAFGTLALVLAVIGVYGLISYAVVQSRREIAIRMAIGARGKDVIRVFVGEGLALTAAGLSLGIVGALATTRLLEALLFGVTSTDVATFVAMAALLGLVAAFASYVPARRSAGVDPLTALRHD
jgi:predicted permease